jgi:RNA polymerase sigma factor (sigma-70 family)
VEDIKLVEDILDGNIDSFNILVNKYEYTILKFIYNMIKDKEASEDITQEVFITVYNKLYMYDKKRKLINWMFQIAKNKCIDYMRKYKRVYESNIEEVRGLASKEETPDKILEYNETKKQIEEFINGLDEIDKQILIMKYSEDITFADIGNVLDMNVSAIKRRYYKARDNYKIYRNQMKRGVSSEL